MAVSFSVCSIGALTAGALVMSLAGGCGRSLEKVPKAPEADDERDLVAIEEEMTVDEAAEPGAPDPPAYTPPRPKVYPDYYAAAVKNAGDVFRSMRPDFRECYKEKLAANPEAHASIVFNVLIGPMGAVRSVEMTGGALLGDDGRECLAARVRKATFTPVHGGGTLRIKLPMEFRAVLAARDAGADR